MLPIPLSIAVVISNSFIRLSPSWYSYWLKLCPASCSCPPEDVCSEWITCLYCVVFRRQRIFILKLHSFLSASCACASRVPQGYKSGPTVSLINRFYCHILHSVIHPFEVCLTRSDTRGIHHLKSEVTSQAGKRSRRRQCGFSSFTHPSPQNKFFKTTNSLAPKSHSAAASGSDPRLTTLFQPCLLPLFAFIYFTEI